MSGEVATMVPDGGTFHHPPGLDGVSSADDTIMRVEQPRPSMDATEAEAAQDMSSTSELRSSDPTAAAPQDVMTEQDGDTTEPESLTPRPSNVQQSPPATGPSAEAAALLLNFSAHPPLPSRAEPVYPHTPPQDSPNSFSQPPHVPSSIAPSSPAGLPTPSVPSPEPQPKPAKQKRKRSVQNAVAGPSRQSSSEPGAVPHSMGEENNTIRCICGLTEDDGFTIQCEGCFAWEHGQCFGYPDANSAPENYYCELCAPRPFDAAEARLRAQWRLAKLPAAPLLDPAKKSRSKTKRPRTEAPPPKDTDSVDDNRDPNGAKPKRRSQPSKPRSKAEVPPSLREGTEEDDFFRVQPWELEYTPIKDNVVRGCHARKAMAQLYREWVDSEEDTRKSRPSYHDSGLPSPTDTGVLRLSPENLFCPPDFGILAPPVPPVFLSGTDLSSLAVPVSVRATEDTTDCLPVNYREDNAHKGIYARPTIYSVHVQENATPGAFLGEYVCEILDAATYRQDPINQYGALGIPKPYVHCVGPPVNLVLDARSYGNELRFVRNGCHPNAVIRPIFHRPHESAPPKLLFGVFASRELAKTDEIVLGWDWDDQHLVHTLRALIDSTLKNAASKPPQVPPATVDFLTAKFGTVLTNIFGTFQSCACTVNIDCAFAQMRRLLSQQGFLGVSGARARKRIDLGELIGAVRGWRRRELEAVDAAKVRRFRTSSEWEVWRAGSNTAGDEASAAQSEARSELQSERDDSEAPGDIRMKAEDVPQADQAPEDDQMDVEEDQEPADEEHAQAKAETRSTPMDVDVEEEAAVEPEDVEADRPSTPEDQPVQAPAPSSSLLSSVPTEHQEEGEDELPSGNESDATTVTIARSQFSDGENELEPAVADVRPASTPSRRGRRIVSPAVESSSSRERAKPRRAPSKKARTEQDRKRRARKNVIESSDEDSGSEDEPETPKPRRAAKGKAKRPVEKSDVSEDESRKPRKDTKRKEKRVVGSATPVIKKRELKSPKAVKVNEVREVHSPVKAEPRATTPPAKELTPAPQQATPPPEETAVPLKEPTPPPKELTPPREPTPEPKEPTPPPKELTPPPKEPTPPPPKKVSMREYLATHKIRKVSNPATDVKSEASVTPPAPPETLMEVMEPEVKEVGKEPPVHPSRLNFLEHLPSSRPAGVLGEAFSASPVAASPATASPATEISRPLTTSTPSSAYVPRGDYFGSQPQPPAQGPPTLSAPAYVPRPGSGYGRDEMTSPVFSPRDEQMQVSPMLGRPPLPLQTPPRPPQALPDIPPALGVRDGPPHHPPHQHFRPPTGPRAPPTGPRGGGWGGQPSGPPVSGANAQGGPVSPVQGMRPFPPRGGFGGRGGYGDRGFYRGRGHRGRGRM